MKEARYFFVPDAIQMTELPEDEAQHAIRVLRLKSGDEMWLVDGKGGLHHATVTMTNNKHCLYEIDHSSSVKKTWSGNIHLAIAPTKMADRIEWMTEKNTEIGFDEISFLDCKFSERHNIRTDRIEKIVLSAMKQSHKAWLPKVNAITTFTKFIQQERPRQKFIAHCYNEIEKTDFFDTLQNIPSDEDITVLIGPEGDFSIDEVKMALEAGYQSISLGESRLRTETAGLSAVMMAQLTKRI